MPVISGGKELDLTNSKFVRDPILKIDRALLHYDFLPI